jgi:hypothetical protein
MPTSALKWLFLDMLNSRGKKEGGAEALVEKGRDAHHIASSAQALSLRNG